MIKKFTFKRLVLGLVMVLTFSMPGFGARCSDNGVDMFCQWSGATGGCFIIDDAYNNDQGLNCGQLINQCRTGGGILFRDVNPLLMVDNGAGQQCASIGGVRVDASRFCYYPFEPAGPNKCKEIGPGLNPSTDFYCTSDKSGVVIANCNTPPAFVCDFGYDYCGAIPFAPNAVTELQCIENTGQIKAACPAPISVCPFGNPRPVSAPLRASYAKGGVSVSWDAGSKISGGTISLVNIKGAAVASAPVKGSGSISANFGFKTALPAGMYFVRVNAQGANGRQIVQQVPVSIVK